MILSLGCSPDLSREGSITLDPAVLGSDLDGACDSGLDSWDVYCYRCHHNLCRQSKEFNAALGV